MHHHVLRFGKRVAIAIGGGFVLLAGAAMLVLPGPGVLVILLGLATLSLEFELPRVWLARLKARGVELKHRLESRRGTPWHIWVVGILSLLWNASGAYTIVSAQAGRRAGISADEAAYYAAQSPWLAAVTDVALLAAIAAGIALLLGSRWATWLFGVSLAAIIITNVFELAAGTSRMMTNSTTVVVTSLIWVLAVLQLWYARAMRRRGILR